MRRLAVTGAFAVPLSLFLAGTSGADTADGPYRPDTVQSSTTYAGIGGAGTTHEEMRAGHHGWWWTEQSGSIAGPGGAAVLHHSESGTGHHHGSWTTDTESDGYHGNSVHDNDYDTDNDTVASHSTRQNTRHVAQNHRRHTATHAESSRPGRHRDHDAGYVDKTLTADVSGATSSKVASHAGTDYATYESADLAAGPGGATSQGVQAVAVPEYAGYKSWYNAADATGAVVHEVSSVADSGDGNWTDRHRDDS
ncbi:hypothetical protein [Amycolatopsis sp. WQ 127309]|uniref:hypothetical protein n=1 Tax=Amycolatopsis sp. WQ 127309 TaxID=2932773 RepID=UPI001FF5393F|nr:hypothetical protein [Amycolatopsis sp. WQ 127309]UOZ10662.1 hypothetical protein MUY22_21320 [Amycolatopsis sp. WQ 127309]